MEIQSLVKPHKMIRFRVDEIVPTFSHGVEVSKAYADTLVQIWEKGCLGLDQETQWERSRGICLLTEVVGKPNEMEKAYRAANDGLKNGASRCWGNTLLQILSLSTQLREALKTSKSVKVVNLLKVLSLLQDEDETMSRVVRSKQTNAAADIFYNSMGGIFANKRHNCLDEGYRTLLHMLSEECMEAYNLFAGIIECQSVCQTCRVTRIWEQVLTLPVLGAPKDATRNFDFVEALKQNIVGSNDICHNMCESCATRTKFEITYSVKVLPVAAVVGIHRKYYLSRGTKLIPKKSTSPVENAKREFKWEDQYGEVIVSPKAWGVHYGPKPTEGHYVAYTAKGRATATCYNDNKVSQVDIGVVDETLISHVYLEFTRPDAELTKTSQKRTRDATDLIRVEKADMKKLKVTQPEGPGEMGILQNVGGGASTPQEASTDVEASGPQAKANVPEEASRGAKATQKPTREMEGCAHYANDPAIEPGFEADSYNQENLGDTLTVFCWNTRSYRSILTKARLLPFKVGNFDVVVLTETQADLASLLKHAKFEKSVRKFNFGFWNACRRADSWVIRNSRRDV